jgi:hypothetical protein
MWVRGVRCRCRRMARQPARTTALAVVVEDRVRCVEGHAPLRSRECVGTKRSRDEGVDRIARSRDARRNRDEQLGLSEGLNDVFGCQEQLGPVVHAELNELVDDRLVVILVLHIDDHGVLARVVFSGESLEHTGQIAGETEPERHFDGTRGVGQPVDGTVWEVVERSNGRRRCGHGRCLRLDAFGLFARIRFGVGLFSIAGGHSRGDRSRLRQLDRVQARIGDRLPTAAGCGNRPRHGENCNCTDQRGSANTHHGHLFTITLSQRRR